MLAHDLPPWSAVPQQTRRWVRAGCFEAMAHNLRAGRRLAVGKHHEAKHGFVLLPLRWVVERTFGWATCFRGPVRTVASAPGTRFQGNSRRPPSLTTHDRSSQQARRRTAFPLQVVRSNRHRGPRPDLPPPQNCLSPS